MNTEQAFEKMVTYFSQKGTPPGARFHELPGAIAEHQVRCVYLDDNGNRCVIGCLLPDHLAQQAEELGGTWSGVLHKAEMREKETGTQMYQELRHFFDGVDKKFLMRAQQEHDSLAAKHESLVHPETFREKLLERLHALGDRFALPWPEVAQA